MLFSALKPVLLEIVRHLEELCETLSTEYNALSQTEAETLLLTAETKHRLSGDLNRLETKRQDILQRNGLGVEKNDLMAYLARHPQSDPDNTLTDLWRQIGSLTHESQRQNQINGLVIEKQRRRTETALALLQGRPQQELYSAHGACISNQQRNALGKA